MNILKEKNKILVTGASGFVGSNLVPRLEKEGYTVTGLSSKDIDFSEIKPVYFPKCDIVIHLAAMTNIIKCEKEIIKALAINGLSCAWLTFNSNMKIIYLSTDQVFDGEFLPKNSYTEYAIPNPINWYGKSKLMGENFIKQREENLILRCGKIYGDKIPWVDKLVSDGKQVYSYIDQTRSYIHIDELCDKIVLYLKDDISGIKHIPGVKMNRYNFIKTYYFATKPVVSSTTEHGKLSPLNTSLRSVR